MMLFQKFKTIDRNKTYDTPVIAAVPLHLNKIHYEFKVVSKYVEDMNSNEYVTVEQAMLKGVPSDEIIVGEDFVDDHVDSGYRFEYDSSSNVNHINAKRSGFGVIKVLKGELAGSEYMFPLHESNEQELVLSLLCYGYLTHGYIDKWLLKQLKKGKEMQEDLMFIVGEFGGEKLYNEIMNYEKK